MTYRGVLHLLHGQAEESASYLRRAGRGVARAGILAALIVLSVRVAAALDVIIPKETTNRLISTSGNDLTISWDPTTQDILSNPEVLGNYRVYRGTSPGFLADKPGGSNRIGSTSSTSYTDAGAAGQSQDYFYLISAIDAAGNEGNTRPSRVKTPPTIISITTDASSATVVWSAGQPGLQVSGYKVVWGTSKTSPQYSQEVSAGSTSILLSGLLPCTKYYFGVLGFDSERNMTTPKLQFNYTQCPPPPPPGAPGGGGPTYTTVCGHIATDTTWDLAHSPYEVTCDIHVYGDAINSASLTIQPGVTVTFNPGTYLFIGDNADDNGVVARGALNAAGTTNSPITLTAFGSAPSRGYWGGLYFLDGTVDSQSILDHVIVQYGGSDSWPADARYANDFTEISVRDSSPTIQNVTITDSWNDGLYAIAASPTPPDLPIQVTLQSLTIARTRGNGLNIYSVRTRIYGCDVSDADVAGISTYGVLDLDTSGNTVHDGSGDGFFIKPADAAASVYNNTAQRVDGYGMHVNDAPIHVTNNTLDNGVFFDYADSSFDHMLSGNTINANSLTGFVSRVGAKDVQQFLTTNTILGASATSRLEVIGNDLQANATWPNPGYPLVVVQSDLAVGGTGTAVPVLSIAAGTTIRFAPGLELIVGLNTGAGQLVAQGSPSSPILFTSNSAFPLPGDWSGIFFSDNSRDGSSMLDYCTVEFAGDSRNFGADIYIKSSAPTITHSTIRSGASYGLYLTGAVIGTGSQVLFNTVTGNSLYGVYFAGSPSATVQHNNFLANGSGAIGDGGATNLDARLNWYGDSTGPSGSGPGAGQSVSPHAVFEPWLTAPFSVLSYAGDLFSSTKTFAPGSYTRFSGSLSENSVYSVRILNSSGTTVRTVPGGVATSTIDITWDGKDDSNHALGNGNYTYRLETSSSQSGNLIVPATGRVTLNSTDPRAEVTLPTYLRTQAKGANVTVTGSASNPTNFSSYTLLWGSGRFPTSYTTIINSTSQVSNGTLGTWNTAGLTNGIYSLRLSTSLGDGTITTYDLPAQVLDTGVVTADPQYFSPNGDGHQDTVTAYATLSEPANWTLDIAFVGGSVVKSIPPGFGQYIEQAWNGIKTDGSTAIDGSYEFRLTAARDGNNVSYTSAPFVLDNTMPCSSITSPTENATVTGQVNVIGCATDANLTGYTVEWGAGASPSAFYPIRDRTGQPGYNEPWYTDNDNVPDGLYTIRTTVRDLAGNASVALRHVNVVRPLITQVTTSNYTISTFTGESTRLGFYLRRPASATIKFYYQPTGYGASPIRTMAQSFPAGPGFFTWDGKDDSGNVVADEAYIFSIVATESNGNTATFQLPDGLWGSGANGTVPTSFNPYTNTWLEVYADEAADGTAVGRRVRMWATENNCSGPCPNQVVFDEPHEPGTVRVDWDGRDPSGNFMTDQITIHFPPNTGYYLDAQNQTNYVIVVGDTPRLSRLSSNPYRMFMSYSSISTFSFTMEQRDDALVTVTVLPPNKVDPNDPSGRHILTGQSVVEIPNCRFDGVFQSVCRNGEEIEVSFDPIDPTDANADRTMFNDEGVFTFVVETWNPNRPGSRSLKRGVVNVLR